MGTTVAEAVSEILDELRGPHREQRTRLDGAIASTSSTTFTVDSTAEMRAGDWAEVNSELTYVDSVTDATNFEGDRGERSSTPATHADNDIVIINPRWWRHKVDAMLRDEFESLPRDLFAVSSQDLDFAARNTGKALVLPTNTKPLRIVSATRDPKYAGEGANHVPLVLVRNNSVYSSGWGAEIAGGWHYSAAETVQIFLAHTFRDDDWTDTTDLEDDTKLSHRLVEALKFGVMAKMQSTRELQRVQASAQQGSRRTEDVEQMSNVRTSLALRQESERLIEEERFALIHEYGVRQTP